MLYMARWCTIHTIFSNLIKQYSRIFCAIHSSRGRRQTMIAGVLIILKAALCEKQQYFQYCLMEIFYYNNMAQWLSYALKISTVA